MSVAVI